MALFGPIQIGSALSAANAVTDEVGPNRGSNINEITFYLVGSLGVASGAVQVEEAHTPGYTGTWAPVGSPVTITATAVKTVKASGVGMVYRARVSTVMGGGTVDVFVMGR